MATATGFLKKRTKNPLGENRLFCRVLEKLGSYKKQNETRSLSLCLFLPSLPLPLSLSLDKDLNVRPKTLKLLEQNTEEASKSGVGRKRAPEKSSRGQKIIARTDQWDPMTCKRFCPTKQTTVEQRDSLQNGKSLR